MEKNLIIITEYCRNSNIEDQFIILLKNEGLIETQFVDGNEYLYITQLGDIEKYARWYYDLSINIEGIDIIQGLLKKVEDMQEELFKLRKTIDSYKHKESFDFDNDLFN